MRNHWPLWLLPFMAMAASPASAHGAFGSSAPFWSGVFHVAVTPLAIAATLGFAALIAFIEDRTVLQSIGGAALAAFAAVLWAPPSWSLWVPLGAIVPGVLVVVAAHPPRWIYALLSTLAGLAAGIAANPDERSWGVAFGVAVMVMVIASGGVEILLWLKQKPRLATAVDIGRRVIGAWVAAIGLLLGALAFFAAGP